MTKKFGISLVTLVMALLIGTSAMAASISGYVTNNTGKSGRIYLALEPNGSGSWGLGTSIAGTGTFTINGVQPGQYTVRAYVDTQGTGIQHANDPRGSASANVTTGNASNINFPVSTPGTVTAQAPPQVVVYPGDGANFVMWEGATDGNDLPIADKYTVSWSSSATGVPVVGSRDVPHSDKTFFAHLGGSSSYYYRVTAVTGGTSASSPWIKGTPTTATGSVTGKVNFPATATGPLYVALVQQTQDGMPKIHVVAVQNPVSGGTYTATNVPPGYYEVFPILDMNNNGTYDPGDIGFADSNDFTPKVSVGTTQVTAADVTLANVNAVVSLTTSYGKQEYGEWYNLDLDVQSMMKQVVKVQLASGPQLSGPTDLALDSNSFSAWLNLSQKPVVGDTYQVNITYADGSYETVSPSVTGFLDNFATPVAPVGTVPFNPTPTFSWTPPDAAPAQFQYSIWLSDNYGNGIWDAWGIPGTETSVPFGSYGETSQSQLSDGTTYYWTLSVEDVNGNRAEVQKSFTPSSYPAINSFSPPGGLAGTSVTVQGSNLVDDPSQYTVMINGVPATVTAATTSSVTFTVPEGAWSGQIEVMFGSYNLWSENTFFVSAPLHVSGVLKTTGNVPIAGATVAYLADQSIQASTAADGSFTLDGIFAGSGVTLKVTKTGYATTYAKITDWIDASVEQYPVHLYTPTELTSWGNTSGKGAIVGQVLNQMTTPYTPVAGVITTCTADSVTYYLPKYYNGVSFGGSSTYANGIFIFPNLPASNINSYYVQGMKTSWSTFGSGPVKSYADSVTEVAMTGQAWWPSISSFSPISGKPGTSVVIQGDNFSSTPAENLVSFNGVPATVTSASGTSLTVTVPNGANTGYISVETAGGSNSAWPYFTMRYTLTSSVTGSGGGLGTLTSVPAGLSCRSNCSAEFDQGTEVQVVATADGGSVLSGLSGACTGTGDCFVTMNGDRSVNATFGALQYLKNMANYYSLLQEALDNAANGDTILAQAQLFTDSSLDYGRSGIQVKIKGGYDGSFAGNTGFTTLDGRLNVSNGTLRVEKFKIR